MSRLNRLLKILLCIGVGFVCANLLVVRVDSSRGVRWVELESQVLHIWRGSWLIGSTSMWTVELAIEADRPDTKRVDRWLLRMPAAYVAAWVPKTTREESAGYDLNLMVGSGAPGNVLLKRAVDEAERGKTPPPKRLEDSITVVLGRSETRSASDLARENFRRHEDYCQKLGVFDHGLTQVEDYPPDKRPSADRRPWCLQGDRAQKFVAGGKPGQHEIVLTCYRSDQRMLCRSGAIVVHGWSVFVWFHPKHLPRWREIFRQVRTFLDKHTVESTTGLPSSDLDWL